MKRRAREVSAFLVVGGTAFVIGAVCLEGLIRIGVSPYLAQVPTLALAIVTTWAGNRRWTFRAETVPTWREFGRYVSTSLGSLLINMLTFSGLSYVGVAATPAFAAATIAAMGFNFLGYKFAVFARR